MYFSQIGTLFTNHLVAHKILIFRQAKEIKGSETEDVLKLVISKRVSSIHCRLYFKILVLRWSRTKME